MKKIFLISFFFFTFSFTTLGQVVTPSLDPVLPDTMPMAVGWRQNNVVGGGFMMGSGQTEKNFQEENKTILSASNEYLFDFRIRNFSIEGYYSPFETRRYQNSSFDGFQRTSTHAMIVVNTEYVSIGAVKKVWETEYTNRTKTVKSGSFGAGLSFKMFEWLFIGAGKERETEFESDKVKNYWMNTYAGWAMIFGTPESSQFRFEYVQITSPYAIKSAQGLPDTTDYREENIHYKTRENRFSVELKVQEWLFSYYTSNIAVDTDYTITDIGTIENTKYRPTRYGFGLVSHSGLVLTAYKIDWRKDVKYGLVGGAYETKTDKTTDWKINLGYTF